MRNLIIKSAVAAALLCAAPLWASQSRGELRGEGWDDAKGGALIDDGENEQKEIRINASAREPNSTFSIWLIDETPMLGEVGIGSGGLTFGGGEDGRGAA